MEFLNPWALGMGAGALSLPVIIHWLTRPRPMKLPLSTIRFVREVVQQRRTMHWLRNLLILTARVLALALLAAAFARPMVGQQPLVTPNSQAASARVVILDVSQSMDARVGGVRSFERARAIAEKYLSRTNELTANLVFAAARGEAVFQRCSPNLGALRDALADAEVKPERLNIQHALSQASECLAAAGGDSELLREVVVVSDFQRSNWTAVDFRVLPTDTRIQLESVMPADAVANVGVLKAGLQGRAEQGHTAQLQVEVGNYAPAARQVRIQVDLAGATYQLEGLCPANASRTFSTNIECDQAGWHRGKVSIDDISDALPADDTLWFVAHVHEPAKYTLITRESAEMIPSSSYFLERALVPQLSPNQRLSTRIRRVDPDDISQATLADSDLIAIDHPGKLDQRSLQLVAQLVRRGRPLLYFLAEPVDAVHLEQLATIWEGNYRPPVVFQPSPALDARQNLFITDFAENDVPFRIFGDQVMAAIGPLRFSGGLASQRADRGIEEELLAVYGDGSAAMVRTQVGAGMVTLMNMDLARSNLPRSPAFVPMLSETVVHMLQGRQQSEPVVTGEPMAMYLPPEITDPEGLTVHKPESFAGDAGELSSDGGWVIWQWMRAGDPGMYEVTRDGETVFAVATQTPAVESDLRTLKADVLQGRLSGGRAVDYRNASAGQAADAKDTTWAWLAFGCVLVMLLEIVFLKVFRT
jgi:hypothetical protein